MARSSIEPTMPTDEKNAEGQSAPFAPDRHLLVIKRLLWVLAIVAITIALYLGSAVFIPLTAALLVSLLFKPVVHRLEAWRVSPGLSALLIVGVMFAVFAGALTLGSQSAKAWIDQLPRTAEQLDARFRDVRQQLRSMNEATEKLGEIASGKSTEEDDKSADQAPDPDRPVPVEVKASAFPGTVFDTSSRLIAGLVVTLVLSFFMLASGDLLLRQLVQALPALRQKRGAVEAWRDLENHVSAYLVTVTLINAGLGLAVWGVLALLGMPNAMWWGMAAAVANYVPYAGALLVALGLFLVGALAYDTLWPAVGVTAAFVTLTSIEGYLVTPMVLGRRLRLNPLILFFWLVFWSWMWGVAGALLAVPMLVCFKIMCDHVDAMSTVADVLSGSVRRAGEAREEAQSVTPQATDSPVVPAS